VQIRLQPGFWKMALGPGAPYKKTLFSTWHVDLRKWRWDGAVPDKLLGARSVLRRPPSQTSFWGNGAFPAPGGETPTSTPGVEMAFAAPGAADKKSAPGAEKAPRCGARRRDAKRSPSGDGL